ncbi:MAG: polysaccharide biosynthesis C-terminal domain-containing protein [Planctomycetaceae bacterium]|nr:polysaccharide biosynthesis C-terminal domain-containing protein [Planctomycetaceae bacterium]
MYQEKPFRLFMKYAIPQMIGLLLNSVYLIVDGMFIGNRLGRDAMAAAAIAVPVVEILIALALAISVGASIIISSSFGSGDNARANRAFNLSIVLAVVSSILIAVFGNIYINQLAMSLGSTPDIQHEAVTYLWYIVTGSPFLILSFAFSSYARADNQPKLAMIALAIGSVSNIILDYVFMYPLNMGIAGAALATALGPIFSVIILLPHFLRGKGMLRFSWPQLSPKLAWNILYLGAPAFVMEFSIGIVTLFYNIAINRNGFGEIGLAAYLTIGYIALIILTVFLGIAQGIQPLVSYFHGKHDHGRNRELMGFLFKMVAFLGIVLYAGVVFFSGGFIAIFTPSDAELIAFTHSKATIYFSGFVFAGITILVITFFQSIQRAMPAFVLALFRSAVFVPIFLFGFPVAWGAESIWIALSVAELVTFVVAGVWYYKSTRVASGPALPNKASARLA